MNKISLIGEKSEDIIFKKARTHHAWLAQPIEEDILHNIYDLCKWGPTSTNCCPMRIVFVKSAEAKEKLKLCLAEANIPQMMSAPLTAIIAYDLKFYEKLDFLSPENKARTWFEGREQYIQDSAIQNSTLQGAYFVIAARAYGLDCGPMSGFDRAKVDAAFFEGTSWRSNFLCNLGYGDPSKLYPRGPRLEFEDVCQII
jgi:3-hydroxypropanoate dehydrogenase